MIIDNKKFTEVESNNKSVVTFNRTIFENLKPLIDSFEVGVIHDISFDGDSTIYKMYTNPLTFSKSGTGYTLSFVLSDVPEKDIEASHFKDVKPFVNDVLQTASVEMVKKYKAFLDDWSSNTNYKKSQRIVFNGIPYSIVSEHTSKDGDTPDKTPLLYEDMTKEKEVKSWDEKAIYNKGDMVITRGIVFVSKINKNVGNEPGFGTAWDYYKN